MHFKIGKSSGAVLVALGGGFLLMRPVVAETLPSNLTALKGEMKIFEAVIDGTVAPTFAPPFGLLENTKGVYMPGFGLAFSLEVNLYPTRVPTLFIMTLSCPVPIRVAKRFQFVQQKIISSTENSPHPYLGRDRN